MRCPMRTDEHAQNNGHVDICLLSPRFCGIVIWFPAFGALCRSYTRLILSSLWHLISVSHFCSVYFNVSCWKQSREHQKPKSCYLWGLTWHATMLLLFHPLPEQGGFVPRAKFQGFTSKTRDLNLKIHSCRFTFIIRADAEQCPISCLLNLLK
jgi:hypothetical protein